MSIKDFIKDRETPYSKIIDVKINDDTISYSEKYDLNHPLCPVVRVDDKPTILTFNQIKDDIK